MCLVQTGHRDIALLVVQGGQQADERDQRIGHHSAPDSRMQAMFECAILNGAVHQSPQ